jgi:phosphoesterase RecJ-like protein
MELSPKQQISELIKQSQRILVVSHKDAGGDAVGSMLALERVLSKSDKEITLVLSEKLEENLAFLPGIEKLKTDITGARDLIIRVNKDKYPVDKLSYNEEDGFLNIVLTPKTTLEKDKLEFVQGKFKYDLIFVLDTADVENIDSIYDRYTELFFETPIVNIDHHGGNEYFGTVNMVDLTATSTSEILVSIIEAIGPGNFDADVATCLLTGIIADTSSFKNTNTTPKSLTISAQMLAAGARQQEIIQNLYKTRQLSTLKLWGKILSNMEYDQPHRMVVSSINLADFTQIGGNIEELHGVMDELLSKAPGTDVVLLLAETAQGKITGKLKGINGSDVLVIAEAFGGSGHTLAAGFDMTNATLEGEYSNQDSKHSRQTDGTSRKSNK